jgi:hypothetical protein
MIKKRWDTDGDDIFVFPLPETILKTEQCVRGILERHGLPPDVLEQLPRGVTDAVEGSLFWNGLTFESTGAGRPVDAAGQLLSSEINQLFRSRGIVGNSLRSEDDEIGVIAEVEAVAQTMRKQELGAKVGVMARPARISTALGSIGAVERIRHDVGDWTPRDWVNPGGLDTEEVKDTGPVFPICPEDTPE